MLILQFMIIKQQQKHPKRRLLYSLPMPTLPKLLITLTSRQLLFPIKSMSQLINYLHCLYLLIMWLYRFLSRQSLYFIPFILCQLRQFVSTINLIQFYQLLNYTTIKFMLHNQNGYEQPIHSKYTLFYFLNM
jgi:hypothetical protein